MWRACNLTLFSPCLTGPVDYPFASCHKGPRFKLHNRWSQLLGGGALWRACNLTAFSPCLTGSLDYPFASCHKEPGFKSPGGGTCVEPGFSCYRCLATYMYLFQLHLETIRNKIIPSFNFIEANIFCYPTYSTCRKIKQVQNV